MYRDQFGEFAGGYWGLKGYAISVWGNCSQSYLHSLDHIHASACRIINHLHSTIEDDLCLSRINWLPIDYIYKRHILLKMFHIFMGSAPSQISELFSKPSRPKRFSNQFNIIRINTEVGRSSFQYTGLVIWNFINKKVKFSNISKYAFKTIIRKQSKDLLQFSFNKEAIMISNKKDDFVYF